ncbi:MAG: hypothetical protein R3C32_02455 [Chloroflexota bacterium]
MRVPDAARTLRVVPEGMADEQAVFVADMLPTGLSGVRRAELAPGDVAVVVGCGTVGLMAILFATRIARTVIAVGGIAGRRALAERMGATAVTPRPPASWRRPPKGWAPMASSEPPDPGRLPRPSGSREGRDDLGHRRALSPTSRSTWVACSNGS